MIEGRQTETYVNIVPAKELLGVPNTKTTKLYRNRCRPPKLYFC